MKPYRKFKNFQIRWKEPMGKKESPYLYRWTFLFFGYSLRIHHWIKSDDRRFVHDHSCDLISMVIRGKYYNCIGENAENVKRYMVKPFKPKFMKAHVRHYLDIPRGGAWTIILCGRPYHKWGFYIKNRITHEYVKWRPLQYFHKYGIIQDETYQ